MHLLTINYRRIWLTATLVASAYAGAAGMAGAARAATTIDVTTTADDGAAATASLCPGASCSLRDAIAYANANPGTPISVPAGVFELNGTQLSITAGVTIAGAGAGPSGTVIEQQRTQRGACAVDRGRLRGRDDLGGRDHSGQLQGVRDGVRGRGVRVRIERVDVDAQRGRDRP